MVRLLNRSLKFLENKLQIAFHQFRQITMSHRMNLTGITQRAPCLLVTDAILRKIVFPQPMMNDISSLGEARDMYFRHPSKLFYMIGIGFGQASSSCHCWWTSFPEKLKPLQKYEPEAENSLRWGKKCSTGQRFIFLKWLLTKSIL